MFKIALLILTWSCLSINLIFAQKEISKNFVEQFEKYNINWNSQSKNSSESMPLGGGDIGCNVWVENGDVLFYLSQSGAFDENNQFLKLGRVRLKFEPNIFLSDNCEFNQELKLYDGYIQIKGESKKNQIKIDLWVDVFNSMINVKINSAKNINVTAFYENWRTKDRVLQMNERHACFSYSEYPNDVINYSDSISYDDNTIFWYHRNRSDKLLFDFCVEQQGLTKVKDQLINTQKNLTFGGCMYGKNMIIDKMGYGQYIDTPYHFWSIKSKKPDKKHSLKIVLQTEQATTQKEWKDRLYAKKVIGNNQNNWLKTKDWWHEFWDRSHIFINYEKNDTSDLGWQVGRNYQLFRYQLACNAYGKYPTKFNGGLFTFDPIFVKQGQRMNHSTPDYRSWGGGSHTAQNQRLVYWPMLKSGDFDMMLPQFDFYNRILKNAELRTKEYWGHNGCCFTEHTETFGLPTASSWGFKEGKRKRLENIEYGILTNQWVRFHYTNQLEFAFMILKYHEYSKEDISEYMPFITSSLTFFFEHYKYREFKRTGKFYDEFNKLVIYPSTACETFKNIKNPTDICIALTSIINSLQDLPNKFISEEDQKYWHEQLKHIPDLTFKKSNGKTILVAAENLPQRINTDIPELYPLYPYGLYGVGKPNLQVAIDTWKSGLLDDRKNYLSWHQDAIFCARMGLTEEAKKITILKMQNSQNRFPSFWGPGHDWTPDHNWGGSGMIGLQEMLLQFSGDQLLILPAWPNDWDVDFKLNAPDKKSVEVIYKRGKIESLITK